MKKFRNYDIDLENPGTLVQVYRDGRRYTVSLVPGDHPVLGPGVRRRYPNPSYTLGYAMAVSWEYQTLLIDLFNENLHDWPTQITSLGAGLVFPPEDAYGTSYRAVVAYEHAISEAIKGLRPGLADALAPFAARHGLDVIPWGLGWLFRKVPKQWSDQRLEVPVTLPDLPWERPGTDPRVEPYIDALILYLSLTGAWRDVDVRKTLHPLVCVKCATDQIPMCRRPICFSWRKESLMLRTKRIKSAIGVHRKRGRPPSSSRWDNEELRFVLDRYVHYWAFQREVEPYF